jgi:hypothetical protein
MTAQTTAHVEVLTAEVRVLMVGSRQVTLSVYRQLDPVEPEAIEPFGRVRDGQASRLTWARHHDADIFRTDICVVGRTADGTLVRSVMSPSWSRRQWEGHILRLEGEAAALERQAEKEQEQAAQWPRGGWDGLAVATRQKAADNRRQAADWRNGRPKRDKAEELYRAWQALPLIVLAGLR